MENKNALKSAEARRKEGVLNGEGGPQEAAHTITIDDSSLDAHDLRLGYQLGYDADYKIGFAPGCCRPGSATRACSHRKEARLIPVHLQTARRRAGPPVFFRTDCTGHRTRHLDSREQSSGEQSVDKAASRT